MSQSYCQLHHYAAQASRRGLRYFRYIEHPRLERDDILEKSCIGYWLLRLALRIKVATVAPVVAKPGDGATAALAILIDVLVLVSFKGAASRAHGVTVNSAWLDGPPIARLVLLEIAAKVCDGDVATAVAVIFEHGLVRHTLDGSPTLTVKLDTVLPGHQEIRVGADACPYVEVGGEAAWLGRRWCRRLLGRGRGRGRGSQPTVTAALGDGGFELGPSELFPCSAV